MNNKTNLLIICIIVMLSFGPIHADIDTDLLDAAKNNNLAAVNALLATPGINVDAQNKKDANEG